MQHDTRSSGPGSLPHGQGEPNVGIRQGPGGDYSIPSRGQDRGRGGGKQSRT